MLCYLVACLSFFYLCLYLNLNSIFPSVCFVFGYVLLSSAADLSLLSKQAFFMTWDDHEVINDFGPGADEGETGACKSRVELMLKLCCSPSWCRLSSMHTRRIYDGASNLTCGPANVTPSLSLPLAPISLPPSIPHALPPISCTSLPRRPPTNRCLIPGMFGKRLIALLMALLETRTMFSTAPP